LVVAVVAVMEEVSGLLVCNCLASVLIFDKIPPHQLVEGM
jgi:hypothetical protein